MPKIVKHVLVLADAAGVGPPWTPAEKLVEKPHSLRPVDFFQVQALINKKYFSRF